MAASAAGASPASIAPETFLWSAELARRTPLKLLVTPMLNLSAVSVSSLS